MVFYQRIYGDSLTGSLCEGGPLTDVALRLAGDQLTGSFGDGFMSDIVLPMFGDNLTGSFGDAVLTFDEDGQPFVIDIYGDSLTGSFGDARLFTEFASNFQFIYFPDADLHLAGSAMGEASASGSEESQGG